MGNIIGKFIQGFFLKCTNATFTNYTKIKILPIYLD